jgi:hypothetical protein
MLHLVVIHKQPFRRNFFLCVRRLLVTAKVPSSLILVSLMMEALSSSETSVITRSTRRNISEDDILHSYLHEILKSYRVFVVCEVETAQGNTKEEE